MSDIGYAKEFMAGVREADRCSWCGGDTVTVKAKKLCRHCNEIRKDLDKIERQAKLGPKNWFVDWELRITRQKKRDCIAWGEILEGIFDGSVTGLSLEGWFRMIAKGIARDDVMHRGLATLLGWSFDADQRQMLAYLFWKVFAAQASHNRWGRAVSQVSCERRRTATI